MSEDEPSPKRTFSPQAVHLVRTVTMSNMMLSQMADQKASLLMGAAVLVFTLAVGQASRGMITPALVLLGAFAFIAACLAVAAVLPSFDSKEIPGESSNILFFGEFSKLSEDEFADHVIDQLTQDEAMFRLMLRDIHQNGLVLRRKKYRLLGWSYRVFLAGLTLSFAAFAWEQLG